ncbi:MAG TPA: chorismate mutase [Acidimicrobiales bacterium]|nr:chorismate mutase [Acidimicrobiales bacterium]
MAVRALRGATTVDADTREQVSERVAELLAEVLSRNAVMHDDLISMFFTATSDVTSMFPATAARAVGMGDIPLLCSQELNIDGGTPRCIRVLVHLNTERTREHLHHVYLHGASGLRDDLPE